MTCDYRNKWGVTDTLPTILRRAPDHQLTMPRLHDALRRNITAFLSSLPPSCEKLIFDVGTSTDPLMPSRPDVAVLGFEPIVHSLITMRHPRLHITPAAVAGADAIQRMQVMGIASKRRPAMSSSLSAIDTQRHGTAGVGALAASATTSSVIVLSAASVLALVPSRMSVWLLKTDMQGHDFPALSSLTRDELRRAHYVQAEASLYNIPSYAGASNDFCAHHVPLLQSAGYRLEALHSELMAAKEAYARLSESQALVVRGKSLAPPPEAEEEVRTRGSKPERPRACTALAADVTPCCWMRVCRRRRRRSTSLRCCARRSTRRRRQRSSSSWARRRRGVAWRGVAWLDVAWRALM